MKIIDENGVELVEEPDLTKGHLVMDEEIVHHDAILAVRKVSHLETVEGFKNGGKMVKEVIDVPPVAAKPAWDESVQVQRYVLYTDEELAAMAEELRKQQEREQLPDRVAEVEDALCEQDAANAERMGAIEDAICELDAAINAANKN